MLDYFASIFTLTMLTVVCRVNNYVAYAAQKIFNKTNLMPTRSVRVWKQASVLNKISVRNTLIKILILLLIPYLYLVLRTGSEELHDMLVDESTV